MFLNDICVNVFSMRHAHRLLKTGVVGGFFWFFFNFGAEPNRNFSGLSVFRVSPERPEKLRLVRSGDGAPKYL